MNRDYVSQSLQHIIVDKEKDPIGKAIKEFVKTGKEENIIVHSPMFEDDILPVKYLFRKIDDMPSIEQKALSLCNGRVLDVGAGSGCHALELQKSGFDVTAIDISPLAVDAMRIQGLKNVINISIQDIKGEYDTILLLMNGIGIAGSIDGLKVLLHKLHSLLKYDGIIILDSSDVAYLFEMEDGSYRIDISNEYYGTIPFQMSYREFEGDEFNWLYIDPKTLDYYASEAHFKCKIIKSGSDGYSYLATLQKL